MIERLYTLDRGITELLIDRGIKAALIPPGSAQNPEAIASMIEDHKQAVDGVFDFVKGGRVLSTGYINQLHALMTQHQRTVEGVDAFGRRTSMPLLRGQYKLQPNNPVRPDGEVYEYCPPEQVASEMDRLIEMHGAHSDVAPEVEAAWLHHRFTQIHPFQDGNGRIARTLATLVFVKEGWFPLVVRDSDRAGYIEALEAADNGDLTDLVEYFSDLQKGEFVKALSIAEDVLKVRRVDDAISSVRRQLAGRRDSLVGEWESAKSIATHLCDKSESRLTMVAQELHTAVRDILEHAEFFADRASNAGHNSHYFRYQIIQTAKALGYFANTHAYRSWSRLVMKNANQTELLIAFHGIGHEFRGVLACSATWFQRVETEAGEREIGAVTPVADRVFQINYKESQEAAEERFLPWLENAIVHSLDLWQSTVL